MGVPNFLEGKDFYEVPSRLLVCVDGVYVWMRGNQALYVGMSNWPIKRVVMHDKIGVVEAFKESDNIYIIPCAGGLEAFQLETKLILELKPRYNVVLREYDWEKRAEKKEMQCIVCGIRFLQKRWWQERCSKACRSKTALVKRLRRIQAMSTQSVGE